VAELVSPMENFLNEKKASDANKRQLAEEMHSAVEVGGAETKEVEKALDEICAQNQVIAVNGSSRKRHHSSQEEQFLSTATTTNDEAKYDSVSGNDASKVKWGRKAIKMNEHDSCIGTAPCLQAELQAQHTSPNQIVAGTDNSVRDSCSPQQEVRSSCARRKRPAASSCERTEIEAAINSSGEKISRRHDPSEEMQTLFQAEQEKSSSRSSNQSEKDLTPAFKKSKYATFDERIEELRAFKAKFGHCNVTQSQSAWNKPYLSLGYWCSHVRSSRRVIEKLSNAQIERLDAVGFQWKLENAFDKRIEELRAFKAKFGHCNVTQSRSATNKPYLSLGHWCRKVRLSRRLEDEGKHGHQKLSNAQIERLDALGFQWESKNAYATFDDRIEELRAFKAKFGHCNVTTSKFASNKPYMSLGKWCKKVRHRRLEDEGRPGKHKLSNAQIERLNAVGFQWKLETAFDKRIEELRAFKAKFGHCNVSRSKSPSNKPYLSLGYWCYNVRHSRTLIEEGKQTKRRLSKAKIERLDAVGFQWE
jgi:hypothetical protein